MRFLLRRRRPNAATVVFDEVTGAVCDPACRAEAVMERARATVWLTR
ncbi:hypothetical protein [Planomonospora venezuelensis]|uniref:Uncharacterized protein n=1 Tax=Planomonospora venezuelensis TaxID=1999 RepID=A0A841DA87_PLAVE|nr:hypothetical protein [Planomonospora venezuelensis]MBB5967532.1 hypothetical protein [Planomonospora venezuelensis]GIN04798.1 hypothetical protein Pve01_64560 [Planomonospora venezuelensis]